VDRNHILKTSSDSAESEVKVVLSPLIRFGIFEVDLHAGELRRRGSKVSLQRQPFQVLAILLEHPGDVVTRDELRQKLWPADTTVDFESGLNRAINRLREALGDTAKSPHFIENLPRIGYRFTASILRVPSKTQDPTDVEPPGRSPLPGLSGPGVDPSSPPYVGPQPFSPDQLHQFFGRTSECDELVNLVEADPVRRVIVIYSPSGAGKTSLLNTAVRMVLTKRGYAVLPVARLGVIVARPAENQNLYTAAAIASMAIDPQSSIGSPSWSRFLSSVPNTGAGKVLIVDQLEEIVTTQLGPPREKREFFLELLSALETYSSLRVLFALREEFLLEIQRMARDLEPYWRSFALDRLRLDSAKEAITRPAETDGVTFDDDVVKALVEELARVRYVDRLGQSFDEPGEFVEPLHLQVVCQALWRCLPAKVKRISWTEINQAIPATAQGADGPVQLRKAITTFVHSALKGFCGNVLDDVTSETGFPTELIELGCQQFISKSGTRLLVHQQTDDTGFLPNRIVEALARRHLLRIEDRSGERWYELAHDTLIEPLRVRTHQIDMTSLQQLWLKLVRKITVECADAEAVDDIDLIHRLCRNFSTSNGAAIRVPTNSLESEIVPSAINTLCQAGLIRRTSEQQETFYELSHPRLALALYQIRSGMNRDPGPLYDVARIVFSSVGSIIASIMIVMVSRSLLQGFHLTLTQANGDGFVNGWFQGVIGAIDWSVFIAGALSSWWFLIEHCETRRTGKQPLQAAIIGGAAGLLGGALVTANLLYAQSQNSLYEAGWILNPSRSPITAFNETGFAYCMILFGAGLGLASGLSMIRILRSAAWKTLVARHSKERSLSETVRALARVFTHIFRHSWYVFLVVMAPAALLADRILSVLSKPPGLYRVVGECLVISLGGEGIVAGLLFGIFALRTGFAIPAPQERS
jgi:DNA-binding winged helix-turn-helix (wHTH) protein